MSRLTWIALAAAVAMATMAIRLSRPPRVAASRISAPADETAAATVPMIRVLLTGGDARRSVRIEGSYQLTALDDWRVLAQGDALEEAPVEADSGGVRIGRQRFAARRLKLTVRQSGTLWVDDRRYRGDLVLLLKPDAKVAAVNHVAVEDYLASVLSSEMPANFPLAAQQSQVVVARSYALFQMKTFGRSADFDVYDSTRSQVYLGMQYTDQNGRALAAETKHSRAVVEATRDIVLTYRGRLFCTYYSAACGGHTASGEQVFGKAAPPLIGVACDHCREAPNYRWQRALPRSQVDARLAQHRAGSGHTFGWLTGIEVDDPGKHSIAKVTFTGSGDRFTAAATTVRQRILPGKLPSPRFDARITETELVLEGRGWGHTVGFCQWGARGLAKTGLPCERILAYYFPGSEMTRVR